MSAIATRALTRLLEQAEDATERESSKRSISLLLSRASFPDYLAIESASEKEECNADFLLAEHRGAITVRWDERAGEHAHAERLVLVDGQALAQHLGVVPRWAAVAKAREALAPHLPGFGALEDVLDCWARGSEARKTTPDHVSKWLDAVRVIRYCSELNEQDVPVRRASAALFGDSKRIQKLWSLIDVLAQGSIRATARDEEEVLSDLGLVRFPPTLMLSANAQVQCTTGLVKIVQPYVGLAPEVVQSFEVSTGLQCLLTIENLTTFHEAARRRGEVPEVAVLYTGGMPSPSWRRVYTLLLRALPQATKVMHWGDVDAGGFRIAAHIAELCNTAGRRLELHSMSGAATRAGDGVSRATLRASDLSQIRRLCEQWGWQEAAEDVATTRLALEQESMRFSWPTF